MLNSSSEADSETMGAYSKVETSDEITVDKAEFTTQPLALELQDRNNLDTDELLYAAESGMLDDVVTSNKMPVEGNPPIKNFFQKAAGVIKVAAKITGEVGCNAAVEAKILSQRRGFKTALFLCLILVIGTTLKATNVTGPEPNPPKWPDSVRVFRASDTDVTEVVQDAFRINGGSCPTSSNSPNSMD